LDNTPAQYLSRLPVRDTQIINFLSQVFPNPFNGTNPIYGSTTSRGNLLRPSPQFSGVAVEEPVGFKSQFGAAVGEQYPGVVCALRWNPRRWPARWDFAAIKNFQIAEKLKIQYRAECLNAWNHPNLFAPNTT